MGTRAMEFLQANIASGTVRGEGALSQEEVRDVTKRNGRGFSGSLVLSREVVSFRSSSGGPGERASPSCPVVPASAGRRCRGKRRQFSDRIGCQRNGEFPPWRETWEEPGGMGGRRSWHRG